MATTRSVKPSLLVIGAGLPRTGTSSLQEALHILGYNPCHHMESDVLATSFPYTRGRRWTSAFRARNKDQRQAIIRAIFDDGGYKACVDFPPCHFTDDLIEMYPNAKVILSVRKSPDAWRRSFTDIIDRVRQPWFTVPTALMPGCRMMIQPLLNGWESATRERHGCRVFGSETTDLYIRHNEWVRKVVPKERLLEHEASQGWAPLCKFLGVPVPADIDYPHMNDSKAAKRLLMKITTVGTVVWVVWIMVVAVTLRNIYYRS